MLGLYSNAKNIFNICKLRKILFFKDFLRPCSKIMQNRDCGSLFKSLLENNVNLNKKSFGTKAAYDINTNVAKDVILFKYENPKFFHVINLFALSQFLFWNYLSHFAFTTLRDAPVDQAAKDEPWYKRINLGDNKYRNTLTICSFLIGYGILAAAWLFTLRSIRFLVLHKGGKSVSFVTYGPFNKNRIMSVPLNCVSAETSREVAKTQLPIKVKNRKLYYILDMRGEFSNPKLFDYTVGLKRKLD